MSVLNVNQKLVQYERKKILEGKVKVLGFITIIVYILLIGSKLLDTRFLIDIPNEKSFYSMIDKVFFGAISFYEQIVVIYFVAQVFSREYEVNMQDCISSSKNAQYVKRIKVVQSYKISLIYIALLAIFNFFILWTACYWTGYKLLIIPIIQKYFLQFSGIIMGCSTVLLISYFTKTVVSSTVISALLICLPMFLPNEIVLHFQIFFPLLASQAGNYLFINGRTIIEAYLLMGIYLGLTNVFIVKNNLKKEKINKIM